MLLGKRSVGYPGCHLLLIVTQAVHARFRQRATSEHWHAVTVTLGGVFTRQCFSILNIGVSSKTVTFHFDRETDIW